MDKVREAKKEAERLAEMEAKMLEPPPTLSRQRRRRRRRSAAY